MTPEQRQKVQSQLRDWHELTPEQREQARQRYQKFKQLPPEKREEVKHKWQEKKIQSEAPVTPPETAPETAISAPPISGTDSESVPPK
jgi:hypothetical protein